MEFRYYEYWTFKIGVGLSREDLPNGIRSELMNGGMFDSIVAVDASKTSIVDVLDRYYGIGKRKRFVRDLRVEIDRHELDRYEYYFVYPRVLEWNRNVYFDEPLPSCVVESTCPYGITRQSPVTLKDTVARRIDFAIITLSWSRQIELIVSERIRRVLEDASVTGLTYEECVITGKREGHTPMCYAATVTGTGYPERGDDALLGNHCRTHGTLHTAVVFDWRFSSEEHGVTDFLAMKELIVGAQKWRYYVPRWVVSRRILELLLQHCPKDLKKFGAVLGQKFRPLVTDTVLLE